MINSYHAFHCGVPQCPALSYGVFAVEFHGVPPEFSSLILCRAAVATALPMMFSHQCPEAQRPTGVAHSVAQATKKMAAALLLCLDPACLDLVFAFLSGRRMAVSMFLTLTPSPPNLAQPCPASLGP